MGGILRAIIGPGSFGAALVIILALAAGWAWSNWQAQRLRADLVMARDAIAAAEARADNARANLARVEEANAAHLARIEAEQSDIEVIHATPDTRHCADSPAIVAALNQLRARAPGED